MDVSILKKGAVAIAAAGAMLFAGTAVAAPAQAATGYDRCPHGYFCLFSGYGGTGKIGIFKYGSSDLRLQGLDNNVHSVWNRSARPIEGWAGYNYKPTPPTTLDPVFYFFAYDVPRDLNDFAGGVVSSVRAD
ncbi:peptidase inhibitor family I36 protein [Nocardiopsis potens]|uniref:peptidase inhibitor family I36 protein n=1 Tax=Nocardiopsis potens TaxID=1246458 RepID=UPI000348677A|nr:peptidase inhibitor family I36 protein [Nocardiopsis potens]